MQAGATVIHADHWFRWRCRLGHIGSNPQSWLLVKELNYKERSNSVLFREGNRALL